MSPLCVSVPPSEVEILTQSGNALEDERYNEGTDLSLACSVLGGNILCIDQINSPQKKKCYWNLFIVSPVRPHLLEKQSRVCEHKDWFTRPEPDTRARPGHNPDKVWQKMFFLRYRQTQAPRHLASQQPESGLEIQRGPGHGGWARQAEAG